LGNVSHYANLSLVVQGIVAVTGVSGFIGQRLLPLLDASPRIDRIVGLDVRDPARRARKLEFHRADVLNSDLVPYFHNVEVVVHLAAIVGPIPDEALMTRVNCDGTRRVLEAAGRAAVRRFVRLSSAAVYGAWENNAVPLTEEAVLRPNPGFLPAILDAECERMCAEWASAKDERVVTRFRVAPVVGAGTSSVLAATATGRPPVTLRGSTSPVQVVHVDDLARALLLATERPLAGVYNIAADGWLSPEDADALHPRRHLPGLPDEAAERMLQMLWNTGLGDAPPGVVPYLAHPWVVANDRMREAGWMPEHSNEEAILLATPAPPPSKVPAIVAGAAATLTVLGAGWLATRLRRRMRQR
jgi:nucleoside-diphosphate-sugar epimerase